MLSSYVQNQFQDALTYHSIAQTKQSDFLIPKNDKLTNKNKLTKPNFPSTQHCRE